MKIIAACLFVFLLPGLNAQEAEPKSLQRIVAIENVCAWPNLTLLPDGTIIAILFNQPGHGTMQGDVDCYASIDGVKWEKCSTVTQHEPDTIRMNHAAGLAKNGDLLVLCSGWTNLKQPQRPKQADFRDAVLRSWVLRSKDAGRTWSKSDVFPQTDSDEWTEHIPFGDIWMARCARLAIRVRSQIRLNRPRPKAGAPGVSAAMTMVSRGSLSPSSAPPTMRRTFFPLAEKAGWPPHAPRR